MAYPEWAGPFALPTEKKEFETFFWNTLMIYGVYTAAYAYEVWRTIPRMAQHHYRNPSRNAIVRKAIRQTNWPSVTRAITAMRLWGPVALIALMYFGRSIAETIDTSTDLNRHTRAVQYVRGTRDNWWDTSWLVSHGYFHESPHEEHGDHWYSFNPQDIDGSHR